MKTNYNETAFQKVCHAKLVHFHNLICDNNGQISDLVHAFLTFNKILVLSGISQHRVLVCVSVSPQNF